MLAKQSAVQPDFGAIRGGTEAQMNPLAALACLPRATGYRTHRHRAGGAHEIPTRDP